MGKKKATQKRLSAPKRLAKMVTDDTGALINRLSAVLSDERDMESVVSDNDTIRTAVLEALKKRGLES